MIPFLKKYFARLYYPIIWTLVIGILLALPGSMLPSEKKFTIPQFDKFVHIVLFGGFVVLWNLWFSVRKLPLIALLRIFFIIFAIACIYGISMEFVQKYFIPGRDYDEADIIADMIGAGIAYGLCNILLIGKERSGSGGDNLGAGAKK